MALHRLEAGDLPAEKGERKKRKPDLECLAWIPGAAPGDAGALLALGSGSRPQRERGYLAALREDGAWGGAVRALDLSGLYRPLREHFADLNIEGAFLADGGWHLLQRGNKGHADNACISYRWADLRRWLDAPYDAPPRPDRVRPFALGSVGGVPYGFTDGVALPRGGWLFSAVAEDTDDSYADGACAGSAIGMVSPAGELLALIPLAGAPKVEGLAFAAPGRLLLATDPDDPARASQLFTLDWPAP